jgi:hypothetical protein
MVFLQEKLLNLSEKYRELWAIFFLPRTYVGVPGTAMVAFDYKILFIIFTTVLNFLQGR